ncbi:uncharacterized protein [Branchiostoma lanceolatum]|uniref:uncharacterized protein n=1 Tax=Branchiostoma lanceolatum TaxID=7740 RepID=UPI0034557E4A
MIRQNKGSKKIRYVVKDSERQGRDQGRTEDRGLGARAALGSQRYSTATHTTRYGASATPAYESPQRTPTPGTVPREIRPSGGRWGATGGVAGASVPSVTGSWRDKQHGGLGRGRSPATGMASGQGLYRTTTGRDVFPATPGRSVYQPSRRTASPMRSTPDTRIGTPQAGQGGRTDGGFVLVQGEMEEMKRGRYGNFIRSSTPAHRVGTPDKHAPSAYSKSLNTPSFEPREAQKSRSADVPPPQTVRHSGITQRGFSTQPAPVASTTTTKDDRPKGAISAEMPLGMTTSMTESISEGYVVVSKTSGQESQAEDSSNVGVRDDVRAKEEDKPAKGEETKYPSTPHKRSWNEAIGTDDNAKEGTLAPQSKEMEDSSKTTDKDDEVGDGAKEEDRPTESEENKDNRDGVGAMVEVKPTKGQEDKDDRVGDCAKVEDKLKPSEREENKHNRYDVFAKDEDKPTEDPSSPHKRSWDEAIGTEDNAKEGTLETQTEEVSTVPDTIPSQAKAILVTPPPPQSKVKIRRTSSEEAPIPIDLPPVEKEECHVEPPESRISQDVFKKNQHQVRALETEGEEETCQTPEKPQMPEDDAQVKPKASVVPPIHPPEVKATTKLSSGTDSQSQPTISYRKEETIVGAKPPFHCQDVEASATVPSGSQPAVSFVEGEDKLVEETVQPFQIKAKATVVPQDPSPTKVKVMRKSSLESKPLPEFQTIDKLECEVKPQEPLIKTDPLLKNQQQVKVQTTDEEEETLETFGPSGQKPERPADAVPSRAKASLVAPPACPDVTASVTPSAGEGQEQGQPPRDNKQIGEQRPGQGSAHLPVLAGRPPVEDVTTFHHGSTLPYPSSDQPTMPTASQPLHGGAQLPPPPEGLISSSWQYNAGVGQPKHDPSYPPGAPCAPYPPGPAPYAPYLPGPAPYAPYPPGPASEAPHPSGAAPNAPFPPGRAPDAPYPPGRAPDAPYPPPPGTAPNAPYPPGRTPDVPYPPGRAPDAPYPPGRAPDAPYPPPPGRAVDASYPPPPGRAPNAPYPPGRAPDAPYPPGRAPDAPYPPGRTPDAPYTPGRTPDAPYPPGRSPDAPYPPGRAPDAPCPPGTAPVAPYPSSTAPDAPQYPSGPAPYPPAPSPSPSPFYTPPGGAFPYPAHPSEGERRGQEQSSPGSPYPTPHPAFPQRHDPAFPPQLPQGPYPPYPPVQSVYPPQSPYDPYQPSQTSGHLPYPPPGNLGYPPPQPATHHPGQPAQTSQIGPERSSGEAQPDAVRPSVPLQPPPPIGLDFVSPPMPPIGQQPAQYDPTIRETDILSPPYTSDQRQQPFDGTVPPESRESTDVVRKPVDQLSSEELEKRRASFETQNSKDIRHSAPMSPPDKAVLPWRPIEEIISPKPGSIPIPLPWTPSPTQSPEKQQAFDFGGASRRHVTVRKEIVEEECDHRQTKQQATGWISDTRESTDDVNKPVDQLSSEELEKRRVSFETQNSKDIRHSAPMSPPDKAVLPWRPIEEIISPRPGSIAIPLPWTPSPTQSPEKQQAFDFGGASRRHVTVKKEIVEEECDHRQTKEQATGRISDTRESTDDMNKPVDQLSSEELEKRRVSSETQNSKDIRHSAPLSPPDKAVLPWRPIEEIISPKPGSIPIPLPWTPSPTQSPEKQQAFDFGGASRRHVTVKEEIVEEEYDHHQKEQPTATLISDTESGTLHTSYTFSDQDMPTESEKITEEETQGQSDASKQPGSVKTEEEYDDGVVPSGYDKEKASKSKIPTPLGGRTPQEKQDTVKGYATQSKRPEELLHSPPMSPADKAVLPWRPIEEIISPRQGSIPIPLPWTPTPSPEKQKTFDFSGASRRHVTATEEITEQDDDLQTKQPPTTLISDTEPGALCTSYTLSEQDVSSGSKHTQSEVSEDQSKISEQPAFAKAEYQSGVVPSGYDTSPGKKKAPKSKVKDDTSHNREQDDLGPSSPEVEPLSPQQPRDGGISQEEIFPEEERGFFREDVFLRSRTCHTGKSDVPTVQSSGCLEVEGGDSIPADKLSGDSTPMVSVATISHKGPPVE